MSTRFAKQMIYGTFYVVIWVLVIWLGYSLATHKPASCFDNIQNQGELGVDCGGPCATVCAPSAQAINVISVNALTAPNGNDTFLAKITNPNGDFAAQSFSYAFNVYDTSGTLLESYPGQSFLYSQQIKYLLLANEVVPAGVAREDVTITDVNWVTASTMGTVPQLAVQNILTQVASTTVVATGQVANNDTATFNNVFIVAVFKDANGNPVAASQTLLDSLAPDQTQSFSVNYPTVPGIDPALTEVDAYATKG
jgi:hypothetical protein